MGRGANATSAAPALRAIDGGRQTTGHQPPLDPSLDRLWLTRSNELTAVARALLKIRRLSGVQRAMLIKRLNALGAEIGLPQHWQLIEHRGRDGRWRVSPGLRLAVGVQREVPCFLLKDEFDGGLINSMSEARYLGRRICELPRLINELGPGDPHVDAHPRVAAEA